MLVGSCGRFRGDKISQMDKQHAEGYARHPVQPGEFDMWHSEQVWDENEGEP